MPAHWISTGLLQLVLPIRGKFAVILDARLSVCAEKNGWRAEGQAGFRAGKSTVDHVLVLWHMIEATQLERPGGILFCCFVEFQIIIKCADTC
jgi:hypothetical protein